MVFIMEVLNKPTFFLRLYGALLLVTFMLPFFSQAQTYTNDNFLFTDHYKPATFSPLATGGFTGLLTNGATFTQVPVVPESPVRLHKFTVDEATFYVSDQGTFQASSNLVALSIHWHLTTT